MSTLVFVPRTGDRPVQATTGAFRFMFSIDAAPRQHPWGWTGARDGPAMSERMTAPLLAVDCVTVDYGGVEALHAVSLAVGAGEVVAVLGANGAGKTSLLRTIAGLVRAHSGRVIFRDEVISRRRPAEIAKLGVSLVPEGRQVFRRLSVTDNLRVGAFAASHGRVIDDRMDYVFELFPRLAERQDQLAGTLSGGEQQMLAIGRALVARPALLMLDEPSMGLSPKLVGVIFLALDAIRAETAILLVEQNVGAALDLAVRGYLLEAGSLVDQGAPEALSQRSIRAAYMGESDERTTT